MTFKIQSKNCRPNVSDGKWLCALLPVAYIATNYHLNNDRISYEYQMTTITAIGLLLQSIYILFIENIKYKTFYCFIPGLITTILLVFYMQKSILYSTTWSYGLLITYRIFYILIFQMAPKSFTLGEASIIVQGIIFFMINCAMQIPRFLIVHPVTNFDEMNAIMMESLFSLAVAIIIINTARFLKFPMVKEFFAVIGIILILVISLFPVTKEPPIIILVKFIFNDVKRISLIFLYFGLIGLTILTIRWRLNTIEKATTSIRKIFHLLIVLVYIPGILYQCTLLYISTGIGLAILISLEIIRIYQIQPFAEKLKQIVNAFIDEKDSGNIILTPIYLLIGCSIPFWLNPCPCISTERSNENLILMLSGVITIGFGDTAASICGSKIGRFKLPNSSKTIEGIIANIFCQLFIVYTLDYYNFIQLILLNQKFMLIFSIFVTAILEAFTDQVDNLVLPIVFYILNCC